LISIIIPTYNEADRIASLINYLTTYSTRETTELIVSDAGSMDNTLSVAKKAGAKALLAPLKGRAAQMNFGASAARGEILYFVHADTFPPNTFVNDINKAVDEGYDLGRYRTRFTSHKTILRINAFFTRFDWFVCYGGDQTLFVAKRLFKEIAGFKEDMLIMEDYDIVTRAKQFGSRYKIFKKGALVSARKYETNSWFKVQNANRTIVSMYKNGASQQDMVNKYNKMLVYR